MGGFPTWYFESIKEIRGIVFQFAVKLIVEHFTSMDQLLDFGLLFYFLGAIEKLDANLFLFFKNLINSGVEVQILSFVPDKNRYLLTIIL